MKFKIKLTIPTCLILITISFVVFTFGCKKEDGCTQTTWYLDADGDGLGDPAVSILDCEQPSGYVNNNADTDDTQAELKNQYLQHSLNSTFISETYPLRIFVPGIYETNKNLPVIYLLDGEYYFNDLVNYRLQIGLDAIIVGIGNHFSNEAWDLRNRDFLPGFSYNGVVGGHLNFYQFLTQEVIPYIDENYENDHASRSLVGHHAPGLFTNFSLLNENPDSSFFYGFLSMNAEIREPGILVEMAQNLNFSPGAKNIKLHISQVSSTLKADYFNDILEEEAFPWLEIDLFTIEDENTDSFNPAVVEPSFKQGLKFIYDIE